MYNKGMEPTPELIDQLYREEVEEARRMPDEVKVFGGPRLFDRACELILAGLRSEYPAASEAELRRKLMERLDLVRRLENRDDER